MFLTLLCNLMRIRGRVSKTGPLKRRHLLTTHITRSVSLQYRPQQDRFRSWPFDRYRSVQMLAYCVRVLASSCVREGPMSSMSGMVSSTSAAPQPPVCRCQEPPDTSLHAEVSLCEKSYSEFFGHSSRYSRHQLSGPGIECTPSSFPPSLPLPPSTFS